MPVHFRPFEAADQPAFRALNEAWIVKYFVMEIKDYEVLDHPEANILKAGGYIVIGVDGNEPVACCALLPREPGCYEIGKMAVAESRRGQGIGRQLLDHAISQARTLGATRLYLESNARLADAVHLYESAGFRHLPPERVVPSAYARSGLYMEMYL
jgi:GNAT superfamily N-acetyltransferase